MIRKTILVLGIVAGIGSGTACASPLPPKNVQNPSTVTAALNDVTTDPVQMYAGVAVADITPTRPAYLSSEIDIVVNDHYSRLEAKAMVIRNGRNSVVIVTTDIIGFCSEISERIYDGVKHLGFERHQVVLNASHSHSVPAVCDIYDVLDARTNPIADYQRLFVERIVSAIEQANENVRPAILGISESESDICVNRDGAPHRRGAIVPNPDGIIDRRVRLLQVKEPETDKPWAVLVVFGCHPSDVSAKDGVGSFGSEFFGFGRAYVESRYPGLVVLTAQGTGGDVRVAHYRNDDISQGFRATYATDLTPNREFGRRFGVAIIQALKNDSTQVLGHIRAAMSTVELPVEAPPSREFVASVARGEAAPADHPGLKGDPWYRRWGAWMLSRFERGIPFPDAVGPYDIRLIQFGNGFNLVALNGEVQTCIGKKTEERLAAAPTFVLGYSNNTTAYIPCAENFAPPQNGGNYEISVYYWWLWQTAQFRPTVDAVIVDEIVALAQRLSQQ